MKRLVCKVGFCLFVLFMFEACSSSKPDLTEAYWQYHRNNLREWTHGEKGARLDSLLRKLEKPEKE